MHQNRERQKLVLKLCALLIFAVMVQSKNGLVQQKATCMGFYVVYRFFHLNKDKWIMNDGKVVDVLFDSDGNSDWNGSDEERKIGSKKVHFRWIGFQWS